MINARNVRLLSKITMLAGAATLVLATLLARTGAAALSRRPRRPLRRLSAAARSDDRKTVVSILGPGSQELVSSGDAGGGCRHKKGIPGEL